MGRTPEHMKKYENKIPSRNTFAPEFLLETFFVQKKYDKTHIWFLRVYRERKKMRYNNNQK